MQYTLRTILHKDTLEYQDWKALLKNIIFQTMQDRLLHTCYKERLTETVSILYLYKILWSYIACI